MKYEYKIIIDYDGMFIEEAYDLLGYHYKTQACKRWETHMLKKNIKEIRKELSYGSKKQQIDSFKRTLDWVQQTHPELLL
jgi:uncharacterized membrane-anchored protein